MSLLGIDVGTTGCKAVSFDLDGNILTSAYREYPLHSPQPGWAELDSQQVWSDVKACIREVAANTQNDPITALAVSCQGEAVTPVDADGNMLANSVVSFDTRTEPYVAPWEEKFGREKVFQVTGQPLASLFTALKLQWFRDNQPEVLNKARYILGYEDLVYFMLGVEPSTDYTLAARTLLFDIPNQQWSEEFLDFTGLSREQMPGVKPSGTLLGTVPDHVAEDVGLPKGVQVVTGGHDQPCQMLGAGATEAGVAAYGVGTVECIGAASDRFLTNETMLQNNICTYHHTCPGLYQALVYNYTGGILFRWYRDQIAHEELRLSNQSNMDVYDLITRNAAEEPTNLLVLPHFTTTGVPHFDNRSKGAILGLTLDTTRGQIARAMLEGTTYELRQGVELFHQAGGRIDIFRATGGGAKSDYWMQIKADIMGIPVAVPAVSEAGCLGCAILAGAATGVYSSIREAAGQLARIKKTFEPNPENKKRYDERFEWYKEVYPRNKDLFHRMNG